MTPQEIFDKVWDHLNRQGKPAVGEFGNGCRYRALDGSACAVGCLIDDETATLWDGPHGGSVLVISRNHEFKKPDWFSENLPFLFDLQTAHDANSGSTDWLAGWRARMAQIAKNYSLTVPPIPDANA